MAPPRPLRRIALLGASGRLGSALAAELSKEEYMQRGTTVIPCTRTNLDLAAPLDQITQHLKEMDFDILVNTAAFTDVEACEDQQSLADHVNHQAVGVLAAHCAAKNARFVHLSTDYVFDGSLSRPYAESDPTSPLGIYAKSKGLGELAALRAAPESLIIRTSWLFGSRANAFPDWILSRATRGLPLRIVQDRTGSPTYTPDLARWLAAILTRFPTLTGHLHLANQGCCSWFEYATFILRTAGLPALAQPCPAADIPELRAPRPANSCLDTTRFTRLTGIQPRPWQEAVEEYLSQKSTA